MTENYQKLEGIFKKIKNIQNAASILHWDSSVIMPSGGSETRAEQLATLGIIAHDFLTAKENADLLEAAKSEVRELDDWQQANLKKMQKEYDHATALSAELVEKISKATSKSEMVWRSARAENDFNKLAPYLAEVLELQREVASIKSAKFNCSKYDALLDQYEPGLTTLKIDQVFSKLENFLPNFITEVIEKQKTQNKAIPIKGLFPIKQQKELGLELMKLLGFDFNHGRLDTSTHPFCGGVSGDIRITTRYYEDDFLPSFMAVMHETGHALYESNLPKQYAYQPVGRALGMALHESQSLLMEMQVGCSREFMNYAVSLINDKLGLSGSEFTAENYYNNITKVERSLIRVDADEVTYPAHVILRYRLEKQMINNTLEIKDLPEAWETGMSELVGIVPLDNKDGCMQDIHWPMGAFGYFPTYTLGAINAAQIFAAAKLANPRLMDNIASGKLEALTNWLRENIHSKGSKYSSSELLTKATGEDIKVEIYMDYLKNKYL